jgi:hypothetical protein
MVFRFFAEIFAINHQSAQVLQLEINGTSFLLLKNSLFFPKWRSVMRTHASIDTIEFPQ